jgi:hypothetical protein
MIARAPGSSSLEAEIATPRPPACRAGARSPAGGGGRSSERARRQPADETVGGLCLLLTDDQALPAVQDLDGTDASADTPAGSTRTIALGNGSAAQLHVQFFPVRDKFGRSRVTVSTSNVEPATVGAAV